MADYFSFEDVMKELELGEEELKRMVSEGELRAFRDENKMKFRKEDVDNLKKGRITEPTIILPSTPSGETTDETVLDLDIGQETAALSDTAHPAVGGEKSPGATDDDLIVAEPEVGTEAEETFIEEEDTGLSTEPLKLADEAASEETVEADSVTAETEPAKPAMRRGATGRIGRRVAQVPMAVEEEIEAKRAHPIWTVFLLLTVAVGIYSGVFFYDMMRMESGQGQQPLSINSGMAKWILDLFWKDEKWRANHEKKIAPGTPMPATIKTESGEEFTYPDIYHGQTIVPAQTSAGASKQP